MPLTRGAKRKRDDTNPSDRSTTSRNTTSAKTQMKSEPDLSFGGYARLLMNKSDRTLKIGVDFGTGKTCATYVVTSGKKDKMLDFVTRIQGIHARDEAIRFPTVMAIKPLREHPNHATVLFGNDALASLHQNKTTIDHIIAYPKLGLVTDFNGVFDTDREVLQSIQATHRTALNMAGTYEQIFVTYPEKERENISLNTIDDVIIACLKYFLGLLRKNICQSLQVSDDQLSRIFEESTKIAFAVPAFWKDAMVERFLCHIRAAGWPSYCRIWSEPECALAAHLTWQLASASAEDRDDLWEKMKKAIIVCDVGDGTTDLATLKPKELDKKTITFESITEGGGSLCGGRLLDFNIERRVRGLLDRHLDKVVLYTSDDQTAPMSEAQFFRCFQYEQSRHNFDASMDEYFLEFRGNNLPKFRLKFMNAAGIDLSPADMLTAHKKHAQRVIKHIEEQVDRTRKVIGTGSDADIEIVLVGGVTRAPFLDHAVKAHFKDLSGLFVRGSVENYHRPLVAIGCILSLDQPSIGKRFAVKEAYGIPIFQEYDSKKHSAENQADDEETNLGKEARDIMEWIVQVGDKPTQKVEYFDWTVTFYDDDDVTLRISDPRNDASIYPLIVKQEIFSTTDKILGSRQHIEYKKHPEIKKLTTCEISLSEEECLAISEMEGDVGFWQNPDTECWSFIVPVRVILEWHDVRVTWRAEIPKTGSFAEDADVEVWAKEIKFATIEHHGHGMGDRGDATDDD